MQNHLYKPSFTPGKLRLIHFCLIITFIFLTACNKYQYAFVSSDIPKSDKSSYIIEDDIVKIEYTFRGPGLIITADIFNKHREPVYLDLQRSLVVFNKQQMDNIYYGESNLGFIAPNSSIKLYSRPLVQTFINLKDQQAKGNKQAGSGSKGPASFSMEESPVQLRSILAVSTNEYYELPAFYDTVFWVSEIASTLTGPNDYKIQSAYDFYIRESTGFGTFLLILSIVGLSIACL